MDKQLMPGRFVGHLGLDYIDGFKWSLQTPLVWEVDGLGSGGRLIVVPAGYVTDFNSIPRGLWNIFPPTQYGKSSIIHDWLYTGGWITTVEYEVAESMPYTNPRQKEKFRREIHINPTKAETDAIYKEALAVEGCPWFKRQAMWLGVKANIHGGHWSKDGR